MCLLCPLWFGASTGGYGRGPRLHLHLLHPLELLAPIIVVVVARTSRCVRTTLGLWIWFGGSQGAQAADEGEDAENEEQAKPLHISRSIRCKLLAHRPEIERFMVWR